MGDARVQREKASALGSAVRPRFRPEIEALRALSILAVVLYHAGVPGFPGGFVGVDVFFVISGYLITRLLLGEVSETGSIDLVRFWSRRARRLLPNATITLLAVLVLGSALLPRYEQGTLAGDVASAALYVSNYRFASQAVDYFADADTPSPVLHFWSLSVEEQFYIVWPLLLLAAWLIVRRRPVATAAAVLGAIWIASFAAALVLVGKNQPAAFFHTGPRCWQLATGGLLATLNLSQIEPTPRIRIVALWLGLAAIVASVTLFDDTLFYPGAWALLPTIGAAVVIFATDFSPASLPAGGLLRAPPLLWLGARSYSLYLWHWPVLVFLELATPGGARLGARLCGVAFATALAAVMYAAVEDPIRRGRRLPAPPLASLAGGGVAIGSVVLACVLLAFAPIGAGTPTAELARRVEAARRDRPRVYADNCHVPFEAVEQPPCIYGAPGAPHRAVLLGDSHAAQWFPPLEAAAREAGWQLDAWTKSGCPAIEAHIWNAARRTHYEACDRWRSPS